MRSQPVRDRLDRLSAAVAFGIGIGTVYRGYQDVVDLLRALVILWIAMRLAS